MTVAERIERVYRALNDVESPRGARVWFARIAQIDPRSVTRHITGEVERGGPVMAVLRLLELIAEGRERTGAPTPPELLHRPRCRRP